MDIRSPFQRQVAVETAVLDSIDLSEAWPLVEHFATLQRHSSYPDEFAAAKYIADRLASLGIPYTRHEARLYLSLPRAASLQFGGQTVVAKTPSFSALTGPNGVEAPARYVSEHDLDCGDSAWLLAETCGNIVVSEWPAAAEVTTRKLMGAGAAGVVFMHPGERIHEDTCTTIWGSPARDTMGRIPSIPVVNVDCRTGQALMAALVSQPAGTRITIHTDLDQGWKLTHLVVAEIPGDTWPEEFVLLHGHLDSWHVGIGDNAVGDGAMLEIARSLWQHRKDLRRSVRIAWWTGHSTGRYAGSTWYADAWALDLLDNCVAHLNCDSPGCRWAEDLSQVPAMAELVEFTKQAICDCTGQAADPRRMHRAGDCAFNNLGIPATMMLSSTIPDDVKQAKRMYKVGGCGGNNEWHTEDDLMHIADRQLLLRDTRLYTLMVWRLANLSIHPLDLGATAGEIAALAAQYQAAAAVACDLSAVIDEAQGLEHRLRSLYGDLTRRLGELEPEILAKFNAYQRQIARELVALNYSSEGRFHQDPAAPIPPLPALAWAADLATLDADSDTYGFTLVSLRRGVNQAVYGLRRASDLARRAQELV